MIALEIFLLLLLTAASAAVWWFRDRLRREHAAHAGEIAAQRAQREAELAAQAERTAALFDRMVEGILVVGADGRIRLANRAAVAFFNVSPPAAGRTVLEATRHHEVAALVNRLEHEAEVLNHELRLDGVAETRYLQVNALALRTAAGERDGAIIVFHDLTRLRHLEAVRQEFVANVSHELRTPLSLIKSATETLIDGGKSDPVVTARFLDIIEKHANRLTLLIDDLLLLARLDSGRIEMKLQAVPLQDAAQDALDDAALMAASRHVKLDNQVPIELAAQADPTRLRQVLANLIDNAIKYGREGGRVVVGGRALGAQHVELTVRDDGPGIPPEAKARIFERFFRADKARSREQGGTGLGLAIVKNVVQAHGGDIRVESGPATGTEFFITLPAAANV
ncbi:sensor histidine kinase [Horticoccus sp. 23ND18S-11]|uniref:sensor histidine kinase n=1 Tax=Horticoccus sp. 23ND18S-11 TaxID=3391832 RepID=UPI0039C8FB78